MIVKFYQSTDVDGDEADVIFDENDEFPDINLDDDD